jgi:hypothetical protein
LASIAAQHSNVVEWCIDISPRTDDVNDENDEEFSKEFEGLTWAKTKWQCED